MVLCNRRRFALSCIAVSILLGLVLIQSSSQQGGAYDPWLDCNGDGVIDAYDLEALGQAYGSSGAPLNMPMSLAYTTGGWIDISDKRGQNIIITPNVGNLETLTWIPRIWGRTAEDGLYHQRCLDGTGYKSGWNKTYGETETQYANALVQTNDGGYAMAGRTWSPLVSDYDCWLVKTDSAGNIEWNKTYGNTSWDEAYDLVQTSDSGYVLVGYTSVAGSYQLRDAYVVKTNSAGVVQWERSYGVTANEYAVAVIQTNDGAYAVAGYTVTNAGDDSEPWLIKINAEGDQVFGRFYGGPDFDYFTDLVQTTDNGYAISGYTESYGSGGYDFWLVKTDSNGNALWSQTYGGTVGGPSGWEEANALVLTDDGGYALAGYAQCYDITDCDFWLVKTDSNGVMQWSNSYGGPAPEIADSLVRTVDGGYALAGITYSLGGENTPDIWLVKTDASGTMTWDRTYGGIYVDRAHDLVQTSDEGYALAGIRGTGYHNEGVAWLVKTDPFGLSNYYEYGLTLVGYTADSIILYRGKFDPYYNFIRVGLWVLKTP
jgi:hypothetical protein